MSADDFIGQFVSKLQTRAELLRRHGAWEAATTCDEIRGELEREFRAWWLAELSVREAAIESGYSTERLRELVHEGRVADQRPPGSGGEIRVRRADLPRRPRPSAPADAVDQLADQILSRRG
jgi:hypothetical protein